MCFNGHSFGPILHFFISLLGHISVIIGGKGFVGSIDHLIYFHLFAFRIVTPHTHKHEDGLKERSEEISRCKSEHYLYHNFRKGDAAGRVEGMQVDLVG